MVKRIGIILFLAAVVGARHAVPLQGLPVLSGIAFAQTTQTECPPECVIDSMEIITYYPSPYGYYEELRGDKIIVGDSDISYIDETNLPPKGTITFSPMLDDPVSSDGRPYEGSLYYQKGIGGTKGKFRLYDGLSWQDLGGGGDYWKPSTANSNDIYYTQSGNVGIGTNMPTEKLDISGGRLKLGALTIESVSGGGGCSSGFDKLFVKYGATGCTSCGGYGCTTSGGWKAGGDPQPTCPYWNGCQGGMLTCYAAIEASLCAK